MPWDLIFYGSMAIIFIGIMAASARARREQPDKATGTPEAGAPAAGKDGDGETGP